MLNLLDNDDLLDMEERITMAELRLRAYRKRMDRIDRLLYGLSAILALLGAVYLAATIVELLL